MHHTTATQGCLEPTLYLQPNQGHGHPILTPPLSSLGPRKPPVHAAMWTQDRTRVYTTVHSPCLRFILSTDSVILGNLAFGVPRILQSPSVRMWSLVWLEGGVRLGGGSDSCFLPLLTQPREVTESGEDLRVSAWAEYLGPCERPESGVGEGSKGRYLRGQGSRRGQGWGGAGQLARLLPGSPKELPARTQRPLSSKTRSLRPPAPTLHHFSETNLGLRGT